MYSTCEDIDDLHQGGGDVWQEVRGSPTSHLTSCQAQTSPWQGLWAGDPDYSLVIFQVIILLLLLMLTVLLMTFDSWGNYVDNMHTCFTGEENGKQEARPPQEKPFCWGKQLFKNSRLFDAILFYDVQSWCLWAITFNCSFSCPGRGADSGAQPERVREEQGEGAQGKHSVPNTVSNRFDEIKSSMSISIQNEKASMSVREDINEKKTFSFKHCLNEGGRVYPCPIFLALFQEVLFGQEKESISSKM